MRTCVSLLTLGSSFNALETVAIDTRALAAISLIVAAINTTFHIKKGTAY
jgi:hypothetical protein